MKILLLELIYLVLLSLLLHSTSYTVKLLSRNKPADMSTAIQRNERTTIMASEGVDGNIETYFETYPLNNSWFLINLINICKIEYVLLYNKHDSGGERLAKLNISVGNGLRSMKNCSYFVGPGETKQIYNITCKETGKFVFLQQGQKESFHLGEVEVYGTELENPAISRTCLDIKFDEHIYYEGTLSTSESGATCRLWNDTINSGMSKYLLKKKLYDSYKNYCRNKSQFRDLMCPVDYQFHTFQECYFSFCNTDDGVSQLLSYRKPTTMSFRNMKHNSEFGVDGYHYQVFKTEKDINNWWRVDLIELCEIRFVLMFNVADYNGELLAQIHVSIGKSSTDMKECAYFEGPGITRQMYNMTCKGIGQIVELRQAVKQHFSLGEVEVYGGKTVNGEWSDWVSLESVCRYGSDEFTEIRTCSNPSPKNGGQNCQGINTKTKACPIYGKWSDWTSCATACEFGANECTKTRTCTNPKTLNARQDCSGPNTLKEKCPPIHGKWTDWTSCAKDCESGANECTKTRTCTNPKPLNGGLDCSGLNNTKEKCPANKKLQPITILNIFCYITLLILLLLFLIEMVRRNLIKSKSENQPNNNIGELYTVGSRLEEK